MKIIYLTDIHDALKNLKIIMKETEADLYLFSGDIIYKAFFNTDKLIEFCTIQDELYKFAENSGEQINPYDLASRVLRFPRKYDEIVHAKANYYRNLFHKAAKTMKEKYSLIEDMVKKYLHSEAWFLPGNYDIDLQYTDLYERDLHRKSIEYGGMKISGYGGAPIVTSGIPEKLAVKFHEYNRNGDVYSEPEDFFREEMPDIMAIHNPAYGFLDKIPSYGHIGSQGIRRYIDDESPALVLSGHVHEDQGIIKQRNTLFLNPSNFGPVESVYGLQGGGYYTEIYTEGKSVARVNLMILEGTKCRRLAEIDCREELVVMKHDASFNATSFVRKA